MATQTGRPHGVAACGDDEAGDVRRHRAPGRLRADVLLQIEPAIKRHLDGIAGLPRAEPLQHILAEKRAIHAKADRAATRQQGSQLRPQIPQERQARLPVVDVARPILHPQHVGGLRQVRHDRVVARHLPVMRIEAAEGAFDLQARRHHHAVDIDRPRAHPQRGEHARDDRRVDRLQVRDRRHREPLQPPTHRARRGHDLHLAEPAEQRIVLDEGEVAQPPARRRPAARSAVAPSPTAPKSPQPGVPAHAARTVALNPVAAQVPPEQLQPGVRRERDVREFQREIPIDSCPQIGSASSHVRWPFVDGRKGVAPLQPQRKAFFNHKASTPPEFLASG